MSPSRPKRLVYAGREGEFIRGLPARDLDENEIAGLTDQQLADALGVNPVTKRALYREAKAEAAKKAAPKTAKKTASKATPKAAPQPTPEPVAEPAATE